MEFPEHMITGSGAGAAGGGGGNSNMVKEYKSKNINAERRRRAKLKDSHHALRSLVPIITKMSKEATLTDATDYIRKLQEEIRRLEEELRETLPQDENEENRDEEEEDKKMDVKGEVDVIPISRNGFYVKMVCMMSKCRGFSEVVETLGSIGGEMTNVSFNAMDGVCQIMFCLEVEENKRNLKVERDDIKFLLEKMV